MLTPRFSFEPIRSLMSWHPSTDSEPSLRWFRGLWGTSEGSAHERSGVDAYAVRTRGMRALDEAAGRARHRLRAVSWAGRGARQRPRAGGIARWGRGGRGAAGSRVAAVPAGARTGAVVVGVWAACGARINRGTRRVRTAAGGPSHLSPRAGRNCPLSHRAARA